MRKRKTSTPVDRLFAYVPSREMLLITAVLSLLPVSLYSRYKSNLSSSAAALTAPPTASPTSEIDGRLTIQERKAMYADFVRLTNSSSVSEIENGLSTFQHKYRLPISQVDEISAEGSENHWLPRK